ncbi:MAG TPA: molybdate ABC transporter substrate-binding protein [Pseudomonadales bacterium]|nr:molybdate ABC transporter substrate-binding protein [Pseudomonadales bacterium]
MKSTTRKTKSIFTSCALFFCIVQASVADEVKVAVAANFSAAIKALAPVFEQKTGHKVLPSFSASGQLFAQIQNGAPFDVFLSADDIHFATLQQNHLAVKDSAFIYAMGRVVLWQQGSSGGHEQVDAAALLGVLDSLGSGKIAIANPNTAPYGAAAVEVLQQLGRYDTLKNQFVMGENIAQTQQFVESGAVTTGFVALAQIISLPKAKQGQWWLVPENLHAPIKQQAMLLTKAENNQAANAFLLFLKTPEAIAIIHSFGYATP